MTIFERRCNALVTAWYKANNPEFKKLWAAKYAELIAKYAGERGDDTIH